MSTFRTEVTRERPLAPAPLPVLAGVVIVATLLLYAAGTRFENDWAAVFAALGVLGLASFVLDRAGRQEAQRHPHPLWHDQRLPTERSVLKNVVVLLVLLVLVFVAIETALPEEGTVATADFGSPLPYFFAAGFLYLVVPQVFARRIRRRYDANR